MKSGTEAKLKFRQLQIALDLPLWQARGLLDTLWNFVAHNCPAGDIGRFTPQEICLGIDWRGDPEKLIETLVTARWLDKNAAMVSVHDWSEHCEDGVHKALLRQTEIFHDGTFPSLARIEKPKRPQFVKAYRLKYGDEAAKNWCIFRGVSERPQTSKNAPTIPSLTVPSQAKPPPPPADETGTQAAADSSANSQREGEEVSWNSLELDLRKLEVNEASTALADAKEHGLAPRDVLAIIAFYKASPPGKWKPGGLHYRIRKGTKNLAADEGWPQPTKSAAVEDAQAKSAAKDREKQALADAKQKAADAERLKQLEHDFGTRLDSLDDAAAESLLNGNAALKRLFKRPNGRMSPLVRPVLLESLAKKEGFTP